MTTEQLEKELIKCIKGLPKEILNKVIEFFQFLKNKQKLEFVDDNITADQSLLNATQMAHLEKEFQDYRQIYPPE